MFDDARELEAVFHHRWAVPVIAILYRASGAKFVTLLHKLNLSRDSLTRTLGALIDRGWVMHNPGHGHPLRPEYLLTGRGERLGPGCAALTEALSAASLEAVGLKKWTLPVLAQIDRGVTRFGALKADNRSLAPRALTLALKDLVEARLVSREVYDEHPPVVTYRTTRAGRELAGLVDQVARALEST
jgi:DNA-binding HxlR family transcriptional regulator